MTAEAKTILITGSTDGVGRGVAERLAKPGTTILVHGRDRPRGESLVEAIHRLQGTATFYSADDGMRRSRADAQAYDAAARRQLRALSLDLTGLPQAAG
ncbi:MAG: SDR family NAD(P)-dependent oxidoreductase [Bradyrhizobium sp.]|nr:SDR family NAD(P)-dependent oxidoreductase [Bradyrhizobium sp.]